MNIVSAILAYLGELERRRRYRNTERVISSLPTEVQKDIGWPGAARGAEAAEERAAARPAAC